MESFLYACFEYRSGKGVGRAIVDFSNDSSHSWCRADRRPIGREAVFQRLFEAWRFFIDAVCIPVASMAAGLWLDRLVGKGSIGLTTGYFEFRWFAKVEANATEAEALPKERREE